MVKLDRRFSGASPALARVGRSDLVDGGLDYPVADESRRKANFLASLKTVNRHPPELPLFRDANGKTSHIREAFAPEIARITTTETVDFAFSIAEVAWQVETAVHKQPDPEVIEGHAVLARAAKMYEMIFILQTASEE